MANESKTKIIATIGPASGTKDIIGELVAHHMDIARLNFSWGGYEWFEDVIKNIREQAQKQNIQIPIIQDLSGPRVQKGCEHCFGGKDGESVITEKDVVDLDFGISQNVDYVALSFESGNSQIELLESKSTLFGKGYLSLYQELTGKSVTGNIIKIYAN